MTFQPLHPNTFEFSFTVIVSLKMAWPSPLKGCLSWHNTRSVTVAHLQSHGAIPWNLIGLVLSLLSCFEPAEVFLNQVRGIELAYCYVIACVERTNSLFDLVISNVWGAFTSWSPSSLFSQILQLMCLEMVLVTFVSKTFEKEVTILSYALSYAMLLRFPQLQ